MSFPIPVTRHYAAITAPLLEAAITAPNNDLQFRRRLICFPDSGIIKATSKKFTNHLWYLSKSLVLLAVFDPSVRVEIKRKMVKARQKPSVQTPLPRAKVNLNATDIIITKTRADCVSSGSMQFFHALSLSINFLLKDIEEYRAATSVVTKIAVVNDFAERGVAMIQEYRQVLTRVEEQRQYLLQVVEWHRQNFSQ